MTDRGCSRTSAGWALRASSRSGSTAPTGPAAAGLDQGPQSRQQQLQDVVTFRERNCNKWALCSRCTAAHSALTVHSSQLSTDLSPPAGNAPQDFVSRTCMSTHVVRSHAVPATSRGFRAALAPASHGLWGNDRVRWVSKARRARSGSRAGSMPRTMRATSFRSAPSPLGVEQPQVCRRVPLPSDVFLWHRLRTVIAPVGK